jgi:hypothetical protein
VDDDRTHDPAEQEPCTGQHGGHAPYRWRGGLRFTADLDQYYADVPGFPDLQLYYLHAAERIPCLGRFVRNANTDYAVMDNLHIQTAAIHLKPPTRGSSFKGANFPLILAARDEAGRIRITDNLKDFPKAQQRRIREGWRVAYSGLAKIPGRHVKDLVPTSEPFARTMSTSSRRASQITTARDTRRTRSASKVPALSGTPHASGYGKPVCRGPDCAPDGSAKARHDRDRPTAKQLKSGQEQLFGRCPAPRPLGQYT